MPAAMKALRSTAALPSRRPEARGLAPRARHLLGVVAAQSLLVVSTAVWAETALPRGGDAATLPTASAEVVSSGARWSANGAAPRASLEFDTRQGAGPWDDNASWRMRYVRWAPAGQGAVGLSMGVGATAPGYNPYALHDGRLAPTVAPEVGVRWRSAWAGHQRVDVGAFGAYDNRAELPVAERRSYNARVEMQFRDNPSKFGFDTGSKAFGMQLSGNSRLMLRAKHGRPMVYYRSTW